MPLYEYECDACGRRFERIQKFSDPPETVCPTCGGHVRKLLSSPAIQFKGSGFYITDYPKTGSDGGRTDKKSPDAPASSSTDSSDSKSKSSSSPAGTSSSSDTATKSEPAKTSTS